VLVGVRIKITLFREIPIYQIIWRHVPENHIEIFTLSRVKQVDMGFGLVIGFTELLKHLIAIIYGAMANSRTLHFTTASTKSSQSAAFSPVVAW
jgi:hypothetical protein